MSEQDRDDRVRAATSRLEQARGAWALFRVLTDQNDTLLAEIARWEAKIQPWTPRADKAAYLDERRLLRELIPERSRAFSAVVAACHRTLQVDSDCQDALDLLADAHFTLFLEAEESGHEADRILHETQVRAWDGGRYRRILDGNGSITLRTDPDGAEVIAQRFDTAPMIWGLSNPVYLGHTPLEQLPLPKGRYLLTIRSTGKRDTKYPVHISRGHHWDGGETVPLYTDAEIGDGFVYVPAGTYTRGGDKQASRARPAEPVQVDGFFLGVTPVTMGDYRGDTGMAEQPATGIGPEAAMSWLAEQSSDGGSQLALPTEDQWEKAARGVDGRCFPWGDDFDATLCWMRASGSGPSAVARVGAQDSDISVYGVRDTAGGISEWCLSTDSDPKVVRGGSWDSSPLGCRSASRTSVPPADSPTCGFRICRSEPL
jgi:eukaryotic-like serine/threonine-protein kinase